MGGGGGGYKRRRLEVGQLRRRRVRRACSYRWASVDVGEHETAQTPTQQAPATMKMKDAVTDIQVRSHIATRFLRAPGLVGVYITCGNGWASTRRTTSEHSAAAAADGAAEVGVGGRGCWVGDGSARAQRVGFEFEQPTTRAPRGIGAHRRETPRVG